MAAANAMPTMVTVPITWRATPPAPSAFQRGERPKMDRAEPPPRAVQCRVDERRAVLEIRLRELDDQDRVLSPTGRSA
jgi:hypothetical protein